MFSPQIQDLVRLTGDVPTLWVRCGDVGVVQSAWLRPWGYYEIEFKNIREISSVRVLLRPEQLEVIERRSGRRELAAAGAQS